MRVRTWPMEKGFVLAAEEEECCTATAKVRVYALATRETSRTRSLSRSWLRSLAEGMRCVIGHDRYQ